MLPEPTEPLARDPADVGWCTSAGGLRHRIRPIVPGDERLMVAFHASLSADAVYSRYFASMPLGARISHERLRQICDPDPRREVVLIDEIASLDGALSIIAVARLCHSHGSGDAEAAIIVSDAYQHQGIGGELFRQLIAVAKLREARRMIVWFLPRNTAMRHLCQEFNMHVVDANGSDESCATLLLNDDT